VERHARLILPDEAREVLRFQIQKHGKLRVEVRPELRQVGDETVIGLTRPVGEDGTRHERSQVITFRNRKIIDMQGCTPPLRTAERDSIVRAAAVCPRVRRVRRFTARNRQMSGDDGTRADGREEVSMRRLQQLRTAPRTLRALAWLEGVLASGSPVAA
jgi:hypothetical protein